MKKKGSHYLLYISCPIILLLCCFLSACQNKGADNIDVSSKSGNYKMQYYAIDSELYHAWHIQYFSGNCYVAAMKNNIGPVICELDDQGNLLNETVLELKGDISIGYFRLDKDGNIFCLVVSALKKEDLQKLVFSIDYVHFNKQGKKVSSTTLKFPNELSIISDGLITEEYEIYVLTNGKLFHFDEKFNLSQQYDTDVTAEKIVTNHEGDICVFSASHSSSKYVVTRIDSSSNKAVKEYKTGLSSLTGEVVLVEAEDKEYDFLIGNTQGVFGYSYQKEKTVQFLEWLDYDIVITNSSFIDFCYIGNGRYALLLNMGTEGICLLLGSPQEKANTNDEKMELILHTYDADKLKQSVVAWNKQQKNFRITIKEEISRTQLSLDIATGNSPDIFYLTNTSSYYDYMKKGYFADYYELMEQMPEGIQKEDLLDNIRHIYETSNENLYFLPVGFSIEALAGSKNDTQSKTKLTLKEANALMKEKPIGTKFIDNSFHIISSSLTTFLDYLFLRGFDDYYNAEQGFKTENFKELLSFIEQWGVSEENEFQETPILYSKEISSSDLVHSSLKELEGIYGKNGYELIGYPCEEGTGIPVIEYGVFAIVAKGNNTSAAWDFVQSFYSYEAQNGELQDEEHPYSIKGSLFSIRKDCFEEKFKNLKSSEYYKLPLKNTSATKKEINLLKTYIEHADRILNNNNFLLDRSEVEDIVMEEVSSYFEGTNDLDKMLNILENRINLYTKEKE